MGFWGVGPFDNDWAADWIVDKFEGDLVSHLARLHDQVQHNLERDGRMAHWTAAEVLAAAEICTWRLGRGRYRVPESAWHLLSNAVPLTPERVDVVLEALDLVPASGLPDTLVDAEGWSAVYSDVKRRLGGPGRKEIA